MPDERWLPVVGYEGCYEVSDQGRVRSLARTGIRKNGTKYAVKPRILTPCHSGSQKPSLRKNGSQKLRLGYQAVGLTGPDGSKVPEIHTLVLTAFVGPRPPRLQCRHLNGNPKDNRLINLTWGTALENYNDSIRHGTNALFITKGQENYTAKLSEVDVPAIRNAFASGAKVRELASQYNVATRTINDLLSGITWRHVPMTAAYLDLFGNDRTQPEDHPIESKPALKRDISGRFVRKLLNNTNR